MWNAIKAKKYAPALLIAAALIVLLSSFIYVLVYRQKGEHVSPSQPVDRPDRSAQDISPQQQFVAEVKDTLGVESLQPRPESWIADANPEQSVSFAYPPDLKAVKGSVDAGLSEPPTRAVYLGRTEDIADRLCTISEKKQNFQVAISEYEANDEADDGLITNPPGRLWFNIGEKDEFEYEGKQAVKYKAYNRISTKQELRYSIVYLLSQNSNATLILSCVLYDGVDEAMVDAVFQQIDIQP